MAENAIGGFLGKTTAGLPNWAWGLVIVAGAGVGYLFVRSNNAKATANQTTATAPTVTDTGGTYQAPLGGGGSQPNPVLTVPGGSAGQVPILPPGYTPIYDSQGNLIGWEPPSLPPTQTPTPSGNGIVVSGREGVNPLVPSGTTIPSHGGDFFEWQGTWYTIVPGAGGRIYGVPGKMSYQAAQMHPGILLMAPASYYH